MVENFDEWFHDILEQADITDSRYPIKGMAVWRPYGFQIRKHSMNIIKNLLDKFLKANLQRKEYTLRDLRMKFTG